VVHEENAKNLKVSRDVAKNKEEDDTLDMIIFPRLSQGLKEIKIDYCVLMQAWL